MLNSLTVGRVVPATAECRASLVSGICGVGSLFPTSGTSTLSSHGLRVVRSVTGHAGFVGRGISRVIRTHGITGGVRDRHRGTVTCRSGVIPVLRTVHCRVSGLRLIISSRV